jgi:adenylylsulfate kinase-like enzyme
MTSGFPVLWLYGPPGVGKSTVAWEHFARLAGDELPLAHVDIDQVGMCYGPPTPERWSPEPASDPGRHRLKTLNLAAVAENAREAGAAGLIVSGVVDPERGIDTAALPNVALTAVRLRAEAAELRRRLAVRGRPNEPIDELLRYAEALDRNDLPGVCIDTTALGVDEVLDQVVKHAEDWLAPRAASPVSAPADAGMAASSGPIFWLCGPRPAGLSAVGFEVYRQLRLAGSRAAYLDLEQVGFLRPASPGDPDNHRFKVANLVSVWRTFQASGSDCLVAVGSVDDPEDEEIYEAACEAALPDVPLTICRASLVPNGRPVEEVAHEILAALTVSVPRP